MLSIGCMYELIHEHMDATDSVISMVAKDKKEEALS